MDQYIRDRYQSSTRSHVTDEATKIFNISATELALVAGTVYVGTYGAGVWLHNPTMEKWALKSVRATVVGAPPSCSWRWQPGGDRPTRGIPIGIRFRIPMGSADTRTSAPSFHHRRENERKSLPEGDLLRAIDVPALGRINNDEHYFSQVALGWYLAYLSCAVVAKGTDRQEGRLQVQLAPVPKGIAITFQKRY